MRRAVVSPLALALLAAALSGCATKGTIAELGHPEFQDCLGEERLRQDSPPDGRVFHASSGSAKDGDYGIATWLNEAARREGSHVYLWYGCAQRTIWTEKIAKVCVKVYAADQHELGQMRALCVVPDGMKPIGSGSSDKAIDGRGEFDGRKLFLVSIDANVEAIGEREDLVLMTLARFRDGSVTITPTIVTVPKP